ncbi:MAG: hypothetical protein AB7N24_12075 [Dehalococcoidia bacterium]
MDRGQESAVRGAGRTQNALLAAQEHLYAALRRPQPLRERKWADAVGTELSAALSAFREHRLEVEGSSGLYAEILRDAPWTEARLRQLAAQLRRIEAEVIDLQIEVARVAAGDFESISSIRADAERMLFTLRDLLSKETDLIYERFNQPAALD